MRRYEQIKILILGLICLLMLGSAIFAEEKGQTYSWQELFPDHFERVYIIMKDGKIFRHTSQDEIRIKLSIGMLEEILEKVEDKNYSIKKIRVIIHNHRLKNYFTQSDYRQYWMLKSYGFDGQFLLYCHRTKKIYDIEEKGKLK